LCVARPLVGWAAGTRPVEPLFAEGAAAIRAVVGTAAGGAAAMRAVAGDAAGIARVVVFRSGAGAGAGTRPVDPLLAGAAGMRAVMGRVGAGEAPAEVEAGTVTRAVFSPASLANVKRSVPSWITSLSLSR